MPIVSQLPWISMPSLFIGNAKCSTSGPSSPTKMALVTNRSAPGPPLTNRLCALMRSQPVVGARAGDHQLTGTYLAERSGRLLVAPQVLEDVRADRVTVHGEGETRRTAVTTQFLHDGAYLRVRCTAAAEFFGDARREQALVPEVVVIGRNEFAAGIDLRGPCRKCRSELSRDGYPVA